MNQLLASLDAAPSGRARPVWFDAAAYGRARLLGGGDVPWPAPAELSSFFAKIGGMFRPDAILVDVADMLAQRAAADQQFRAAMAARSRPGYALRTLLADEQARGTAAEAVRVLAATSGPVPLVLSVPGGVRSGASGRGPGGDRRDLHGRLPADLRRHRRRRPAPRRGRGTRRRADSPRGLPPGAQRRRSLRVAGAHPDRCRRGLAARSRSRRRRLARLGPASRASRPLGHGGRRGLLGWRNPAGAGRPRARRRPGRG
jgi:hypothetical protein